MEDLIDKLFLKHVFFFIEQLIYSISFKCTT